MNCVFSEMAAKLNETDENKRGQIGVKTNLSSLVVQTSELSNNFMNDFYEIVMFVDRNEYFLLQFLNQS